MRYMVKSAASTLEDKSEQQTLSHEKVRVG